MTIPGQKTFLQIQQEVSEECIGTLYPNVASATDRPSLTRLKQMINDAYREICGAHQWYFLFRESTFPTVASQQTAYAVSNSAQDVIFMSIQSLQIDLVWMAYYEWQKMYPGKYQGFTDSQPINYIPAPPDTTSNGLQYYLFPAANAVYTVQYGFQIAVSDMSADADLPLLPARWQNLLVMLSKAKVYEMFGDGSMDRWKRVYTNYEQELAKAVIEDMGIEECAWRFRDRRTEAQQSSVQNLSRVLWFGATGGL